MLFTICLTLVILTVSTHATECATDGSSASMTFTEDGDNMVVWTNGCPSHSHENTQGGGSLTADEGDYTFYIPLEPVYRTGDPNSAYSESLGAVSIAVSGVPLYGPSTSQGLDAVTTEIDGFDSNCGHSTGGGIYHHHMVPWWLEKNLAAGTNGHSPLVGWMPDGFAIYGLYETTDTRPTDLDEYGGHEDSERGWHYHFGGPAGDCPKDTNDFEADFPYMGKALRGCVPNEAQASWSQDEAYRRCVRDSTSAPAATITIGDTVTASTVAPTTTAAPTTTTGSPTTTTGAPTTTTAAQTTTTAAPTTTTTANTAAPTTTTGTPTTTTAAPTTTTGTPTATPSPTATPAPTLPPTGAPTTGNPTTGTPTTGTPTPSPTTSSPTVSGATPNPTTRSPTPSPTTTLAPTTTTTTASPTTGTPTTKTPTVSPTTPAPMPVGQTNAPTTTSPTTSSAPTTPSPTPLGQTTTDTPTQPTGQEMTPECLADLVEPNIVEVADLAQLLVLWGTRGMSQGDLNRDGIVDVSDLASMLTNWGETCASH